MKTVIGIIIGVALVLAFQKIITEPSQPETVATTTKQDIPEIKNIIPEDFLDFYTLFHSDSIFQLEHITFPLEGLPSNADSLTKIENKFRWKKEDWVIHKPFDDGKGTFEKKLYRLSDSLIEEIILAKKSNFYIRRRFYKSATGWNLIYYAAVNQHN